MAALPRRVQGMLPPMIDIRPTHLQRTLLLLLEVCSIYYFTFQSSDYAIGSS